MTWNIIIDNNSWDVWLGLGIMIGAILQYLIPKLIKFSTKKQRRKYYCFVCGAEYEDGELVTMNNEGSCCCSLCYDDKGISIELRRETGVDEE